MLSFVFGRAGFGKTTYIHSLIQKENSDGLILLVPEQYTFETEKQMLKNFGSGFMSKVQVLSFSRLSETVGQLYGGISGHRLDDAQRIILVGRAIKSVGDKLSLFKRYAQSPEFVKQVTDIISEFKLAGISEERLLEVVENIPSQNLKLKITEIVEIYAAYNNLLSRIYIDPLDDIEHLIKTVAKTDFLKDKTIYIDAFKGFTGAQIKLLKLMILNCKKVVISLCTDGLDDPYLGAGIFSNIKKVASNLLIYAKQNHVEIGESVTLNESHFESESLKLLEEALSENFANTCEKISTGDIFVGSLQSPFAEVEYALKTIRHLVRTEGYKYSDFVIIARNIEKYERMLEVSARKFSLPCYLDKRRPLFASPLARLIISALKAARKLETESILALIKTGLLNFSDEEISVLEEYVYIWDINHEQWCKDWTMDPDGIVTGEYKSSAEQLKKSLDAINTLRKRIIIPILSLRGAFSGSVLEISKAVFEFLISQKVDKNIAKLCGQLESAGEAEDCDFIRDSWDMVMKLLDNVVRCYEGEEISAEEYIDTLSLAFSGATIGSIPKMLDEVICGSADRIRTSSPKIAFILGVNQGEFPASVSDNGLLLKADRIRLEEAGLEISDRFNSFAVDENFMFYSSICSAKSRVYVLCHRQGIDGSETEESNLFSRIKKIFGGKNLDNEYSLPETVSEGYSVFAKNFTKDNAIKEILSQYFLTAADNEKNRFNNLLFIKNSSKHRLSKETSEKLFGDNLYLSASKIETYNGCAFSYFCRYVLNISPLKKADLDNMQRGTIVHFIMENVLRDFGKGIKDKNQHEIEEMVNKYMLIYLEDIEGVEYLKKPRFMFLYNMIAKMSLAVLLHIAEEFKICSFEPVDFELDISKNGDLPLFTLKFSDEKTVKLNGKIDRVDKLKGVAGDNFIRIVDYKTGSKEFHLPDILYGLNMQMLVYLSAVKTLGSDRFGEVTPAGILYKPSKRSVQKEGENKSLGFAMNGMIVNTEEVKLGMDSTNSGKFAPKDTGKARKGNPIISAEDFETVLEYVNIKICDTATKMTDGIFDINPLQSSGYSACKYCDFSQVCGIEKVEEIKAVESLSSDAVIEKMKEELSNVR